MQQSMVAWLPPAGIKMNADVTKKIFKNMGQPDHSGTFHA